MMAQSTGLAMEPFGGAFLFVGFSLAAALVVVDRTLTLPNTMARLGLVRQRIAFGPGRCMALIVVCGAMLAGSDLGVPG